MKTLLILLACLTLSLPAWSKGDLTPMGSETFKIALEARSQFEETGSWLPLEQLTRIEQIALQEKSPGGLLLFNTFAAVPGAPLLGADGTRVKYPGFRFYAISRVPNFEGYTSEQKKTGGRYAVLFKEEPGRLVRMEIPWIPEADAQILLQQAGNFDPRTAPFAFQDTYLKLGGDLELLHQNNFPKTRPLVPWPMILWGLALITLVLAACLKRWIPEPAR